MIEEFIKAACPQFMTNTSHSGARCVDTVILHFFCLGWGEGLFHQLIFFISSLDPPSSLFYELLQSHFAR